MRASLRWSVYGLLICIATGLMVGRILAVNSVDRMVVETYRTQTELNAKKKQFEAQGLQGEELKDQLAAVEPEIRAKFAQQRPFLSANDRSRWASIRSLVELGTFQIDEILSQPNWDSIDIVVHADRTGEKHFYSSKPPLLSTLLAGEYWLIYKLSGARLDTHPYEIGRAMLITINVLPLLVYFWLMARLAERYGRTDWGRIFMLAAACFGTYLTTFAVTLNNHIPAAVCAAVALYATLRIWYDGERRLRYFALAGFFAALTVPDDLPALSMFVALTVALGWKAPRQTLIAYLPAALLVVVAFFATNYWANDSWLPGYFHRSEKNPDDNWYDFTYYKRNSDGHLFAQYPEAGEVDKTRYTQRKSYFYDKPNQSVIDQGEASMARYALHALVGHHGIFSLTPIWLLTIGGLLIMASRRGWQMPGLASLVAVLSIVCIAFYLTRPQQDRNYGGMCSGFRWVFWFAPLWLLGLLPAADALSATRARRWLAGVLLAFSALSAAYPVWNPWTLPWIYNAGRWFGWF